MGHNIASKDLTLLCLLETNQNQNCCHEHIVSSFWVNWYSWHWHSLCCSQEQTLNCSISYQSSDEELTYEFSLEESSISIMSSFLGLVAFFFAALAVQQIIAIIIVVIATTIIVAGACAAIIVAIAEC
jgi:hypothetical protein